MMNMIKYKCHNCLLIIDETVILPENRCPICKEICIKMCERDHCNCSHDMVETIAYCPVCGAACCPKCGCHDVTQISRVTGYLQEVNGWNAGKQQELKDRTRYNVT